MGERRYVDYTVNDSTSRDDGKTYRIREMYASQAEDWAMRAFLALGNAGVDIPDDVASQGIAGLAAQGMMSLNNLKWEVAKPLLDEMFKCIFYLAPAGERTLIEADIDEVKTRFILRKEVLKLHTDFLRAAAGLS